MVTQVQLVVTKPALQKIIEAIVQDMSDPFITIAQAHKISAAYCQLPNAYGR